MSERPAASGSAEFGELWRSASKHPHNKNTVTTSSSPPAWKDFQSPKHRPRYRYPGLNNADSPGEGEASQDIVWDSTSPTQAHGGVGLRNTRVVEISDIANRIAPKNVKPVGPISPLQQWIGDSAVPCTPEIRKPILKRKSVRHNSVEDLMKLARQFDKNMQQDKESSEQQNFVNSNASERANSSDTKLTTAALLSKEKELKCSPSSDRVEAELHALFDSSTQVVSGRLSQGSSASACSQEMKGQTKTSARPHQSDLKCGSAARKAQDAGSRGLNANTCDDFDDDWENDDLMNDSFMLALTNGTLLNTVSESNSKMNRAQFTSVCKPAANTHAARRVTGAPLQPGCSALQELCPKPKTTNRSTFKLQPNPHFQTKTTASKEDSKSAFTVLQSSKSHMCDQKSTTKTSSSKTLSTPQPDKPDSSDLVVKGGVTATDSAKDIPDCLWGDGADDELLYQLCDTMERISNSQSQRASLSNCKGKQDIAADKQRKTTAPVPIETAGSMNTGASANRLSSHAFVRSNSLPGSSCDTVNYQGWNIPMKGANSDSPRMAQSLQEGRVNLGTFNQSANSSGTLQAVNTNRDVQRHTVAARPPEKPHHTAFKRNLSDSATTSNKVFVTSKMTGKCSAAEIERKKQEALARRRSRMQNAPKP